jgi:hypothetical protein
MTTGAPAEQDIEIVKRQSEAPASTQALAGAPPTASISRTEALSVLQPAPASETAVQSTALELRAGTPALVPGQQIRATVTYYYCRKGAIHSAPALGDGGNFCGIMRDGTIVYPGAAACDDVYLGQRFRILGDPTGRVYKCADTGSAVHGLHRDIWFMVSDEGWVWLQSIGDVATIEILP